MENTKHCVCGNHEGPNPLPLSQFYNHQKTKDGLTPYCKTCVRTVSREQRNKHKDAYVSYSRDYYLRHGPRIRQHTKARRSRLLEENPNALLIESMLAGAKTRAQRKGFEYSLTKEDVVIPKTCPVLGIPLARSPNTSSDNSPTLDRIDSSRGYTKDNVLVVSMRANTVKNCGTPEEHLKIYHFYKDLKPSKTG